MENLKISFEIVAPLLIYMIAGFILRRIGMLREDMLTPLNRIVANFLIPVMVFNNIYTVDFSQFSMGRAQIYMLTGTLVETVVLFFVYRLFEKDYGRLGSMIQGSFRGNTVLYGIPVATALLGEGKIAPALIMLATLVPLYNILASAVLSICANADKSEKEGGVKFSFKSINWKKILITIITNPIVIGVILAILVSVAGIKLPKFFASAVSGVSGVCTPLAFIVLGAGVTFKSSRENRRDTIIVTVWKLVLCEIIFSIWPLIAGWNGAEMVSLLICFATPTAISSYAQAESMGCDGRLAADIVAYTIPISIFTMFLWIFAFKQLGVM